MATNAQIQAALADAQAAGYTWAQIASLMRTAILAAIVGNAGEIDLPWTSTAANGVSITRMNLKEAIELANRLESLDSGGIVGQYVEFRA